MEGQTKRRGETGERRGEGRAGRGETWAGSGGREAEEKQIAREGGKGEWRGAAR